MEIAWRNPDTKAGRSKDWQHGEWSEVLNASTAGFKRVVTNVIKRYAGDDWGPAKKEPPAKKPPAKKAAKQKKTPVSKPAGTKKTKASLFQKRSAASKKGWETRRKGTK